MNSETRGELDRRSRSIWINARFLRIQQPTGTQRSARLWLKSTLPHLIEDAVIYAPTCAVDLREELSMARWRRIGGERATLDHLWEQLCFPARKRGVLWTIMGTGPVVHYGVKHVMCVHDLNFMLIPKAFKIAFRLWYRIACAQAARQADVVVCFTEYVKRSLMEKIGVQAEKIKVIPQGPGMAIPELTEAESEKPITPYFLCVGSLQPHKNLAAVLEAWQQFRLEYPSFRLKVVGRRQARFSSLSIDSAEHLLDGVDFTGYVNDQVLIGLYQRACAFLYPSYEEGFGLPIVEAFYCGCPVVTSNCSCLPEVAGGAALIVNPKNPQELLEQMRSLAQDKGTLRERLRTLGLRQAKMFDWDVAGQRMANVLSATACTA